MNIERLLELADLLETEKVEKHFDMREFMEVDGERHTITPIVLGDNINKCGAVACIAGWAVAHFMPHHKVTYGDISAYANELLGYPPGILFMPDCIDEWETISPKDAAQTIRSYVETGVVDWSWHPDATKYDED